MSNHPHSDDDHGMSGGNRAEAEINYPKVILVGVVSLVIFAACTAWAAAILRTGSTHAEESTGTAAVPKELGKPEIGIVDQVPFLDDHRLYYWREARNKHLNGYGWVDRAKGIAHVPIQQAMDAVANGALPTGAPR